MRFADITLLWKLRRGDREAFEAVVQEHYASVYRQHFLLTGDRERAADLTQETFIEAWRSIPRFTGRSGLRTWLYTIAVRVWRRKGQVNRQNIALHHASLLAIPDPSPEAEAIQAIRTEKIECALMQLSLELRETLILHYRQEMTQAEVALALDIPVGTVKSRLFEGRKRLRKLLSTEINHEE